MLVDGKGLRQGLAQRRGGFASESCKDLYTNIQHALRPLNEVRQILRLRPCRRPLVGRQLADWFPTEMYVSLSFRRP